MEGNLDKNWERVGSFIGSENWTESAAYSYSVRIVEKTSIFAEGDKNHTWVSKGFVSVSVPNLSSPTSVISSGGSFKGSIPVRLELSSCMEPLPVTLKNCRGKM